MSKSLRAIGLAAGIAVALVLLGSAQPLDAIRAFFLSPIINRYYVSNMISNAAALLLSGTGVAIAFSTGAFNLGGEGQAYAGGFAAALVLASPVFPAGAAPIIMILALTAAILASSIQGMTSGMLQAKLGIDPLISSFLFSAALIPLMDGLLIGPLRDKTSNLLSMPPIHEHFHLPALQAMPRLHLGIIIAVAIWALIFLWYRGSRRGYEMRIVGSNPNFAQYAGLSTRALMSLSLALSAGLHGIAGFLALTGVQHAAVVGFTSGIGWNGIAVSLIGGNKLKNLPLSALVYSYLLTAGNAAMVYTDFSYELSAIIQASIFIVISIDFVSKNRGAMLGRMSKRSTPSNATKDEQ